MSLAANLVNVGTVAGDHTGDTGQVPFQKVNAAMTELYTALGGAASGGTVALTATVVTAALNAFTNLLKGLVPASGDTTGRYFLRSDGTWSAAITGGLTVSGGAFTSKGITDNSNGTEITISAGGNVTMGVPSGNGTTLAISGAANAYTQVISASTTTGSSYGVAISAGTNASDQALLVRNAAQTQNFLTISGSGVVAFNGAAGSAQQTGWGTPTGATLVTNFPGASATLVQCSEVLAQLITLLKAIGILGS